jgi:hypothetical protein
MRSLPIAHPEELVDIRIIGGNKGFGISDTLYSSLTRPLWQEIERSHEPLSGVFVWRSGFQNMETGLTANDVRPARTLNVSSEFFNVLGVAPFAGRLIGPEDSAAACTSSNAAVSYSWWQSQIVRLIGTKRMFSRSTASAIASASMKSFLFDFTKGFTNWVGINRTSCPCLRSARPRKWAPEHASRPISELCMFAV